MRGEENQQQSSNRPMACTHPTAITLETILKGTCRACGIGAGKLSARTSEKKVHSTHPLTRAHSITLPLILIFGLPQSPFFFFLPLPLLL